MFIYSFFWVAGKLTHADLDERALDALKEYPVDGALVVLTQLLESNLEHVSNKSAFLCGIMKTYRQKSRAGQAAAPPALASQMAKAPDEEKIKVSLHCYFDHSQATLRYLYSLSLLPGHLGSYWLHFRRYHWTEKVWWSTPWLGGTHAWKWL